MTPTGIDGTPRSSRAPRLVAVLGPPGAGKSTLSRHLAQHHQAVILRMRDLTNDRRLLPGCDARLLSATDPLGWLPDPVANCLLGTALRRGPLLGARLVVLENLPGSVAQSTALRRLTREVSGHLVVVELQAPDAVASERVRRRRVCLGCEPDIQGDPHRPAGGRADAPHDCLRCGTTLTTRRSDAAPVFTARLKRHRERIPAIRADLVRADLPYFAGDATDSVQATADAVTAFLAQAGSLTHATPADLTPLDTGPQQTSSAAHAKEPTRA